MLILALGLLLTEKLGLGDLGDGDTENGELLDGDGEGII